MTLQQSCSKVASRMGGGSGCLPTDASVLMELDASDFEIDTQVAPLGRGSGCIVFRGKLRNGQNVAVKVVNSQVVEDDAADNKSNTLSDLRNEIRIGLFLPAHVNLPRFVGVCAGRTSQPQVLWEMIDGRDLEQLYRLKSKAGKRWCPTQGQGLEWCSQLFAELNALHACGIVHRDVKPANIMITSDLMTLKLIDYGLCKNIGMHEADDEPYRMTGMTGSFRYMAPEVYLGKTYSFPVDIYSGSVVMSFILTGVIPSKGIDGSTIADLAVSINLRPSLINIKHGDLRQMIGQGWAATPSERPSAREMHEKLRGIRELRSKTVLGRLSGAATSFFTSAFSRTQSARSASDGRVLSASEGQVSQVRGRELQV